MSFTTLLIDAAWLIALLALLGSFGAELIFRIPPCRLCLMQRVLMISILVGLSLTVHQQVLLGCIAMLALAGAGVAIYQLAPTRKRFLILTKEKCSSGVSCSRDAVEGGSTLLPILSLIAFMGIAGALVGAVLI